MPKSAEFHDATGLCPSCKGKGEQFSFADFKRYQGVVPDEVAINAARYPCEMCDSTGRKPDDYDEIR